MSTDHERFEKELEEKYLDVASRASELLSQGELEGALLALRQVPDEPRGAAWLHEKIVGLVGCARAVSPADQQLLTEIVKTTERTLEQIDSAVPWEQAECHLLMGTGYMLVGRSEDALREWKVAAGIAAQCQRTNPDCLKLLAQAARECAKAGREDQGAAIAEKIIFPELRDTTLEQVHSGDLGSGRLYDPIPAFLAGLQSSDPETRRQAAHGAGALRLCANTDVRQALEKALDDSAREVREAASAALDAWEGEQSGR